MRVDALRLYGGLQDDERIGLFDYSDDITSIALMDVGAGVPADGLTLAIYLVCDPDEEAEHEVRVRLESPAETIEMWRWRGSLPAASGGLRCQMLRCALPTGFALIGDYIFRVAVDGKELLALTIPVHAATGEIRAVLRDLWRDPPGGERPGKHLRAVVPYSLHNGTSFCGYHPALIWQGSGANPREPFELSTRRGGYSRLLEVPEFVEAVRRSHAAHLRVSSGSAVQSGTPQARWHFGEVRFEARFDLPESTERAEPVPDVTRQLSIDQASGHHAISRVTKPTRIGLVVGNGLCISLLRPTSSSGSRTASAWSNRGARSCG